MGKGKRLGKTNLGTLLPLFFFFFLALFLLVSTFTRLITFRAETVLPAP